MRVRSLILLFAAASGCATTAGQLRKGGAAQVIEMEPMKIEVVRGPGGQKVEAFDAATLFEQAGAELNQQHWAPAAAAYDRLVKDFPASSYAIAALYNAGLALEGQKDYAGAVVRYRALVDQHGDTLGSSPKDGVGSNTALDALFRMGGCYAEIGNWAASAEVFQRVLAHKELSVGDRVEAMGRRGLAQYQMKDAVNAERTFREALSYYRENQQLERLDSDFFLALCQYYMAEISHDQFRALPVRLPEAQMKKDLEAKAQLLLQAQARYVDTARIRNAAWATAAGYQMASLYKEFYDSLMDAPVPPQLSEEAKKVYSEELKKTIEPLLRKAIHAHELTQGVAERNGIDNEWVRKSNDQMEQLRALLGAPAPDSAKPAAPPPPKPSRPENDKREQAPPVPRRDEYHPRVIL